MKYFKKMIGKRLHLSPINIDDAENYIKWMNDEAVASNYGQYSLVVTSKNDMKWLFEPGSGVHRYAIVLLDGDVLIGSISLHDKFLYFVMIPEYELGNLHNGKVSKIMNIENFTGKAEAYAIGRLGYSKAAIEYNLLTCTEGCRICRHRCGDGEIYCGVGGAWMAQLRRQSFPNRALMLSL